MKNQHLNQPRLPNAETQHGTTPRPPRNGTDDSPTASFHHFRSCVEFDLLSMMVIFECWWVVGGGWSVDVWWVGGMGDEWMAVIPPPFPTHPIHIHIHPISCFTLHSPGFILAEQFTEDHAHVTPRPGDSPGARVWGSNT